MNRRKFSRCIHDFLREEAMPLAVMTRETGSLGRNVAAASSARFGKPVVHHELIDPPVNMKKEYALRIGSKQRGFTLIELMVVVVTVAILVAVAYPSYMRYLIRGNRSAAEAHLMDIAQLQQRYLLDARSFAPDLATLNMTTPGNVSPYYTIAIVTSAGPPPGFTATATPKAGTAQASDVTLSIDAAGVKTPSNLW
jgi:type IV pilus assembly protein PilE